MGRQSLGRRLVGRMYRFIEITHPGTVERRDVMNFREIHEDKTATNIIFNLILVFRVHVIPFIDGDNERTPRLDNIAK